MVKMKSRRSGIKKGSKRLKKADKDKICGAFSIDLSVEEIAKIFEVPKRTIFLFRR